MNRLIDILFGFAGSTIVKVVISVITGMGIGWHIGAGAPLPGEDVIFMMPPYLEEFRVLDPSSEGS